MYRAPSPISTPSAWQEGRHRNGSSWDPGCTATASSPIAATPNLARRQRWTAPSPPTGSPAALTGSAATSAPNPPNGTAGAKSPSSSWAAAAANATTLGDYNTAASGTTHRTGHYPAAIANSGTCRQTWDCARKRRQQRRTSSSPTRITRCRPSAAPSPPACRSLPGARSTSAKRRNSLAARATTCRFPPAPTCWSSRANR